MDLLSNGWTRLPNEIFDGVLDRLNHNTIIQLAMTSWQLRLRIIDNETIWQQACWLYYSAGEMEKQWFYLHPLDCNEHHALNKSEDDEPKEIIKEGSKWYQMWCWCRRMEQSWRNGRLLSHSIEFNEQSLKGFSFPYTTELASWIGSLFSSDSRHQRNTNGGMGSNDRFLNTTPWATSFRGTLIERATSDSSFYPEGNESRQLYLVGPNLASYKTESTCTNTKNTSEYYIVPLKMPSTLPHYRNIITVRMDALYIVVYLRTWEDNGATKILVWKHDQVMPQIWCPPAYIDNNEQNQIEAEWRPLSLFNGWLMLLNARRVTSRFVSTDTNTVPKDNTQLVYALHATHLPTFMKLPATLPDNNSNNIAYFKFPGINLMLRADQNSMTFIHLEQSITDPRCYQWSLHKFYTTLNTASTSAERPFTQSTASKALLQPSSFNEGGGHFYVNTEQIHTSIANLGVDVIRIDEYRVIVEVKRYQQGNRWLGLLDTRKAKSLSHTPTALAEEKGNQQFTWTLRGNWNRSPFLLPNHINGDINGRLLLTSEGTNIEQDSFIAWCVDIATGTTSHSITRDWRLEVSPLPFVRMGHLVSIVESKETCKLLDTSTDQWKKIPIKSKIIDFLSQGSPIFYTITHRMVSMKHHIDEVGKRKSSAAHELEKYCLLNVTAT
ncbi:hypothetical protein BDF19DRAFT_428938 [Syncephalis fuscata]|nr:hypothetical protein BDF19DRAFT_428938 [Syncephalis fuscata]